MNYGSIPVRVCKTLYRESKILGKTAVGRSFLPFCFSYFLCYLIGYFRFKKVITNISLLLFLFLKMFHPFVVLNFGFSTSYLPI